MDASAMSLGIKRNFERVCAYMFAVALLLTPVLRGQQEDQAQTRLRAVSLEQQGLNAESEQIWNSIAKANPVDAEALGHVGLLEARQDHYDVAIEFYRRAAAINSDLPGLQMNLGLALFKVAQFPDAVRSFTSEIRKHPGDLRLTILLGMAHYGMKDYLVTIPYLQRAVERDPQNLPLRLTLAHSCLWSKQLQCVLRVQEEIRALKAESAEADMLAGEAYDQMRDPASAAKEFRAAILADPTQPNAHFGMGYLLWTENKWAEAATEFQLELQNDPRHVKAQIYLADSWVRQNEFVMAIPMLERLANSDPSETLVHLDQGIIYADSGEGENAIRELMKAVETDPTDAVPHLVVAKLYRSMSRPGEANAEVDRAKRLQSQSHPSLQEMIDSIETPTP